MHSGNELASPRCRLQRDWREYWTEIQIYIVTLAIAMAFRGTWISRAEERHARARDTLNDLQF